MLYLIHGDYVNRRQARDFVRGAAAVTGCEDEAIEAWDAHEDDEEAREIISQITSDRLEIID